MKGIVLTSHGTLAEGLAQSATFFMGDYVEQMMCCCLEQDSNPEEFGKELKEAVQKVDTGDGVVILVDLIGGTPFNEAIKLMNDKADIIAGMNFPILLELLNERIMESVNIGALLEKGRKGICDAKEILDQAVYDEEEE